MGRQFAALAFTPGVKAQQERHGSRRQYGRVEEYGEVDTALGEYEREFIAARDGFYMATTSETGWPYMQFRGGPKGFLHSPDEFTLAFADLRGNKQYISVGNLEHDSRVALFLMDYAGQQRLKILGRARVLERSAEAEHWLLQLKTDERGAIPERAIIVHIEAFDWNCAQHIPQRYTREEWQALRGAE